MTQVYHQAKFRWTENLTCRFIQLRKENGKLFTGRKYSAQAGWEHILRQMRQEFPTIMADVHYRVLKKKWSNLLQQYKELKNPVHGDKNKADDVSWPFYSLIDEVLGKREVRESSVCEKDVDDDLVDPNEFLFVSVTPEESVSALDGETGGLNDTNDYRTIEIEKFPRQKKSDGRINSVKRSLRDDRSQIRRSMKKIASAPMRVPSDRGPLSLSSEEEINLDRHCEQREAKRSRKTRRNDDELVHQIENRLEVRIDRFIDYAMRRDAENRNIMLRILQAVEKIADKIQ